MGDSRKIKELDDSKTPLTFIAWVPRVAKQVFTPGFKATDWGQEDLRNGRYMFLFYFYGIILYVFLWSRRLYGSRGFWLPVIMVLVDPLFMVYGILINSDIISAFVMVACLYHYYRWSASHYLERFHLIASAVFFGVALATKQGFIFLPFALAMISLTTLLSKRKSLHLSHCIYCLGFLVIAWFVLNAAFYFQGSGKGLHTYLFLSSKLQTLQATFSWYRLPMLIPEGWMQGVDLLQYHAEIGPGFETNPFAGVYVNGVYSKDGVWYYYLLVSLVKFPIGILFIATVSIVVFFKRFRRQGYLSKYQFLLAPIIVYFIVMSFLNPFQIGVRHLLIFLPLVYLGLGYLAVVRWWKYRNAFVTAALFFSVLSVAGYYPDLIPYTNELLADKKKVHEFIYDSSIDYGQADSHYKQYIQDHPKYKFAPQQPSVGKFIVPARFVMDEWDTYTAPYKWLRNYQVTGVYRGVFLLYDIETLGQTPK